ncbi:MAG: hypothetical protein ACM31C_08765 [Acidobacteriota bacterium]
MVAAFGGCIDPSIPIPPPDPTEMNATLAVNGNLTTVSFTYPPTTAYVGGVCEIFNRATGHGVIDAANPDGSCGPTSPLAATLGDNVVFTIVSGSQTVSTCVVLRDGAQDPTAYCQ